MQRGPGSFCCPPSAWTPRVTHMLFGVPVKTIPVVLSTHVKNTPLYQLPPLHLTLPSWDHLPTKPLLTLCFQRVHGREAGAASPQHLHPQPPPGAPSPRAPACRPAGISPAVRALQTPRSRCPLPLGFQGRLFSATLLNGAHTGSHRQASCHVWILFMSVMTFTHPYFTHIHCRKRMLINNCGHGALSVQYLHLDSKVIKITSEDCSSSESYNTPQPSAGPSPFFPCLSRPLSSSEHSLRAGAGPRAPLSEVRDHSADSSLAEAKGGCFPWGTEGNEGV